MARKNVFEGLSPAPPTEPASPRPRAEGQTPEIFQQAGPIAAIRNDLRNLNARSVQEIEPELIEDTGFKDRLGEIDDDLADLRQSISEHGQQVPILLRPHPSLSGRYQVVYGRRRLAAIRSLGLRVKALIRTLTNEEAVLAQGQENNLRKDPSFIEKTLFAGDLEEAGYSAKVIQDALNVGRSHTSHMRKVREALPRDVIERIGPAPAVGWKRWYDMANVVLTHRLDARTIHAEEFPADANSDTRFTLWLAALEKAIRRPKATRKPERPVRSAIRAGEIPIGELLSGNGRVTFRTDAVAGQFAAWLERDGGAAFRALYERYLEDTREAD